MESTTKRQIFLPKRKPTEKQLEAIREKRAVLKELSKPFKELVKSGELETINKGLVAFYAEQGHTNLKTLHQWNEAGKQVIKGEKAFYLWGKPTQIQREEAKKVTEEEKDETDFFPICFVFSEKQVTERAVS